MALRQACTCTRYLSPTRLSSNAAHPTCTSVTSPVALRKKTILNNSRLHSTSTSKYRLLPTQYHATHVRCLSDDSRQGSDVLQPAHRDAHNTTKNISSSLDSIAHGIKQWTQNTKVSIDVAALTKIVSALNIDLPKLPQYRKFLQKSVTYSQEPPSSTSENTLVETDDDRLRKRERLLGIASDNAAEREEHDLSEAMASTQASIQAYYSAINFPMKDATMWSKDDIDAEIIKKSISEDTTKDVRRVASENTLQSTVITPPTAESENILVRQLGNLRQMMPGAGKPKEEKVKEEDKKVLKKRNSVPRVIVERRTRGLVLALKQCRSNASQLTRLQDLCSHLQRHPEAKNLAYKEKVVPTLLKMRGCSDPLLRDQAMEALALVGYNNPVKGRGIRILSLDGGGTRGLMTIVMLRRLEEACGAPIHELFDYVCGVSTGSLIAAMCAVYGSTMDKCDDVYRKFSQQMFNRNKLMGTGKLFLSHAYYDAQLWEEILKENIGLRSFLETVRNPNCPKVAAVSSLVNQPTMENFLFRNYTYTSGVYSHYPGSMKHKIWESIRASSAAPGYYEQFQLDDRVHQDGGILTNNPTALALHECKLLWPNEDIQCVVSLGTGRFRPINEPDPDLTSVTLKNKIYKIVQSATDTESVHTILNDLLPPSTYFRFSPYMSEDFQLDEIRQDKWDQMDSDVQMYCRKNDHKFKAAATKLLQGKLPHQKARDWLNLQKDLRI